MNRQIEPAERRSAARQSCAYLAEIRIGSTVALPAIIKDLSDQGARLQIPENAWLPSRFELHIPSIGLTRTATCRWRRRDFAGLQFDTFTP